jgi:hypothetical protein
MFIQQQEKLWFPQVINVIGLLEKRDVIKLYVREADFKNSK